MSIGGRIKMLRHTHATNLLQAGVPIKSVQYRLGHATAAMTLDVYGHFVPHVQDGIVEKLSGMLRRKVSAKKWASPCPRRKKPVAVGVAVLDPLTVHPHTGGLLM